LQLDFYHFSKIATTLMMINDNLAECLFVCVLYSEDGYMDNKTKILVT
jgi:hypothetical protein